MLSEIGSNFWLNPNEVLVDRQLGTPEQFNCKGEDYVWLSTGRSAIQYVIDQVIHQNMLYYATLLLLCQGKR